MMHLLSFAYLSSYQSIRVIIVKFQYEAFNIATLIKLDEIMYCINCCKTSIKLQLLAFSSSLSENSVVTSTRGAWVPFGLKLFLKPDGKVRAIEDEVSLL